MAFVYSTERTSAGTRSSRQALEPQKAPERSENSRGTILSRATVAVSANLLPQVTLAFKRLFRIHYESPEEIGQAPEWQQVTVLFCDACDSYVSIAMANRRKIGDDLFEWVKAQIETDADSISLHHFGCDRNGRSPQERVSKRGIDENFDPWSARAHWGWMNVNAAWWACQKNIAHAATVALGHAAIRIASGSKNLRQAAISDAPESRVQSAVRRLPICSSAPLSVFEVTVGKLMAEARKECPTKYLPQTEIFKISALLDDKNLPVRSNLEREAARTLAEYNKQHPTAAIKTWKTALSHPRFRRAVRKRFSRAEDKYRKATPSFIASSAGTPRTRI